MATKDIFFVTSNPGKVKEISNLLGPLGYEIKPLNIGYPEVQAETLEEVVEFGLDSLATDQRGPTIIEDAGLFIEALEGFPGVFSAYVQRTVGNRGVLRLMEDIPIGERSARFEACLGYLDDGGEKFLFKGTCSGSISTEARGEAGFGYDPIFIPTGYELTFAEMDLEDKNKVSHRGKVSEKFF